MEHQLLWVARGIHLSQGDYIDFVIETDSPEGSQYKWTVKIYNETKVK